MYRRPPVGRVFFFFAEEIGISLVTCMKFSTFQCTGGVKGEVLAFGMAWLFTTMCPRTMSVNLSENQKKMCGLV